MKPAPALPVTTGTPRECIWSVDVAGRPVCTVRRDLRRAVEGWTGAARVVRDPSKRAVAEDRRKRAIRELSEHHCGPVEGKEGSAEPNQRGGEQAPTSAGKPCICDNMADLYSKAGSALARLCPVHGQPAARPHDSAVVDRIATDKLFQAAIDAAIQWGMRIERRAHPDAPVTLDAEIATAMQRLSDAHAAYHRAMDRYNPQGVR